MVLFDANIILRYLLNDNEAMAERAEAYIDAKRVYVTIEVIAEVIYVLGGVYLLERKEISETLKKFFDLVECNEKEVLTLAVETYGIKGLDFVDCVLYAYNRIKGTEIATFDKKLLKLLESNEG